MTFRMWPYTGAADRGGAAGGRRDWAATGRAARDQGVAEPAAPARRIATAAVERTRVMGRARLVIERSDRSRECT
jgi:hypothetical protein